MYYQYDRASVSHEHRGFLGILWGQCEEFAASYHSRLSRRLPGKYLGMEWGEIGGFWRATLGV